MNPVDRFFTDYIERYLHDDRAARFMAESLRKCGVGLMPVIDHCAIRTHDVETRARDFLNMGFAYDEQVGTLEYENWWAKVYRKPGYPALFLDQGFNGKRGEGGVIPGWVDTFGDECFHHCALLVENIEDAMDIMKSNGFEFPGDVVGEPGSDLRQVFTKPEIKGGQAFSVMELIERHNGYTGFLPPQANGLMESTRL